MEPNQPGVPESLIRCLVPCCIWGRWTQVGGRLYLQVDRGAVLFDGADTFYMYLRCPLPSFFISHPDGETDKAQCVHRPASAIMETTAVARVAIHACDGIVFAPD